MAFFSLSDVFLTLSPTVDGSDSLSLIGSYRSIHGFLLLIFGGAVLLLCSNLLVNHLLHLLAHCLSDSACLLLFLYLLWTADMAL